MSWWKRKRGFKPSCVARALYQGCGWNYDEGYPVRFVVKNISPGVDHIQCQFYTGVDWYWSTQQDGFVVGGSEEFSEIVGYKTLTLEELLKERIVAEKS